VLEAILGPIGAEIAKACGSLAGTAPSTRPVKEFLGDVANRAAVNLPLPENHTLVRTLRTEHLKALQKVLDAHRDALDATPAREQGDDEHGFARSAQAFVAARLKLLSGSAVDIKAVDEAQVRHVLGHMAHPSTVEGYAASAEEARAAAETAALREIEGDAGRPAPALFARAFAGDIGPGWYFTFALYVNEQIKTNDRFRAIFVAAELVDIQHLVRAADARIAELRGLIEAGLQRVVDQVKADTGEILEIVKKLHVASGVPLAPLQAQLRRLGAKDLPAEAIPAQLEQFVDRYLDLECRLSAVSNAGADVASGRARALHFMRLGDLDGAETVLAALDAEIEQVAQQRGHEAAMLKGDRAEVARLKLRYRDAALLLQQAATLVAFDPWETWQFQRRAMAALHDQGYELGENAALHECVQLGHRILAGLPTPAQPKAAWMRALTLEAIGVALARLGERGFTEPLQQAVAVFKEVYGLHAAWHQQDAATNARGKIGVALWSLGERGDNTALRESVGHFEYVLERIDMAASPEHWAVTQNNLGGALNTLAERGDAAATGHALKAHHAQLRIYRRRTHPLQWSMAMNNLGHSLAIKGRAGSPHATRRAICAFRLSLHVRQRSRVPLLWAVTMHNLGLALLELAQGGDHYSAVEATTAFNAALEERTRDRSPYEWALTQNGLCGALIFRAKQGEVELLEAALDAARRAQTYFDRDQHPFMWAAIETNVGTALSLMSTLGGADTQGSALKALEAAHDVFKRSNAAEQADMVRQKRDELLAAQQPWQHASPRD
jgi:hypothetical protein